MYYVGAYFRTSLVKGSDISTLLWKGVMLSNALHGATCEGLCCTMEAGFALAREAEHVAVTMALMGVPRLTG